MAGSAMALMTRGAGPAKARTTLRGPALEVVSALLRRAPEIATLTTAGGARVGTIALTLREEAAGAQVVRQAAAALVQAAPVVAAALSVAITLLPPQ